MDTKMHIAVILYFCGMWLHLWILEISCYWDKERCSCEVCAVIVNAILWPVWVITYCLISYWRWVKHHTRMK